MQSNTVERYAADLPGADLPLMAEHRRELFRDSSISEDVARERGYATIERPDRAGMGTVPGIPAIWQYTGNTLREILSKMGFPGWATRETYFGPWLWIPQYTPRGDKYAGQIKPFRPVKNREGKAMKYASAKGSTRLDVHPRWSADRGQEDAARLPAILDPSERLWITEGVKKADSLTSRGEVTVALAGVFNWRNTEASLGDWEDVRLKGREIVVCFDADTLTKPQVARAMQRLGKWLRYKGAAKVWYCVVPAIVNGVGVKGVDDFFAAGGTLKELERAFETKAPEVVDTEDRFTDARLAETLAAEVLDGQYVWAAGLDWLRWNGQRWEECHEVPVIETVRQWAVDNFAEAAQALKESMDKGTGAEVEGWRTLLSASRQRTILALARGIVERRPEEFDADPDILNTPGGVVRLDTDETLPHAPEFMCTKITSGSYREGFTHPDVDRALEVLPPEVMAWMQVRVGQAITGHTTSDGVVPILKGGGENGKGLLFTDGLLPALGGYAAPASPKLFEKGQHSTEQADLRGQRLVIAEELTEGRSIDVGALKRVADVGRIKARKTHKDNMEFTASHSLFATTNYVPVISETDHGTWRRLLLVEFPYTFVKPGVEIVDPTHERRGDPTLKQRIKDNKTGQHDALVTWAVDGARAWYRNNAEIEAAVARGEEPPASVMLPPARVADDTLAWRIEADRILGHWTHRLVADPSAYVLASEVVEDFNEWLRAGGHAPWPKETFGGRFRDHAETKRNRVSLLKTKRTASIAAHIMRRPVEDVFADPKPLPKQADVYLGVRFRTDKDDES